MQFPAWVEGSRTPKGQRASNRLKFIMGKLALEHTGRNSMRALAEKIGYDHSTFSTYIRRGAFTDKAAAEIVDALGCQKTVKPTYLTDPLNIPSA